MKNKRQLTKAWMLGLFILLFLVLLLSGGASISLATEEKRLGLPPTWPKQDDSSGSLGESVVPDLFRSEQAASETPLWIDTQNREASLFLYLEDYQEGFDVESGWTGNHVGCIAGTTTDSFRAEVLRRINFFRSMAGVPPVKDLNNTYNAKAQASALMMSVNRDLNHNPPPGWTCYTAAGSEGAGSSNLALGAHGPEAISLYIHDPGSHNYPVGHRRWILYPQTQYMGIGDIPSQDGYPAASALWVSDLGHVWDPRPETRENFVAWPPPGYVPYKVVYPRWSFAYPEADFTQATVSMTLNGKSLAVQQSTPEIGYGENTLVWEPQTSFSGPPAGDISYKVTLNNVIIGGQAQNFSYTVIIIDTNAAPFFTSVPTTSTTQDAGYRYAVVADDLNLEDTSLTIATSKLPDWLKLTDRGDGTATLEGTPTNSDVGEHFVELQVTDSSGLIGTQAFSVTVANVNDAPALISTPIAEAEPEILYSYGIVATDPDLIWGDTLSITTLMLPDWLTLTDMGDGTAVLVGTPENDDLGRHPVELRVTDSNQLVDKQSFSITVRRRILLPLLFRN